MPNEEITADSVELNVNSLESIEMPGRLQSLFVQTVAVLCGKKV